MFLLVFYLFLEAQDAIRVSSDIISGAPPSMMSALYFMHYVRSSGNIRTLVEADGDSNNSFRIKVPVCFDLSHNLILNLCSSKISLNNFGPAVPALCDIVFRYFSEPPK